MSYLFPWLGLVSLVSWWSCLNTDLEHFTIIVCMLGDHLHLHIMRCSIKCLRGVSLTRWEINWCGSTRSSRGLEKPCWWKRLGHIYASKICYRTTRVDSLRWSVWNRESCCSRGKLVVLFFAEMFWLIERMLLDFHISRDFVLFMTSGVFHSLTLRSRS